MAKSVEKAKSRFFHSLSRYGVSILAVVIATNQWLLRQDGLSSWKGGGMGMYADFHPVYTKLLLKSKSTGSKQNASQPDQTTIKLLSQSQFYPKDEYLRSLQLRFKYLHGSRQP